MSAETTTALSVFSKTATSTGIAGERRKAAPSWIVSPWRGASATAARAAAARSGARRSASARKASGRKRKMPAFQL